MRFGSLFSGVGGFDLGFARIGLECAWQVEKDPFCRRVLAKHWPATARHDDILTFPPGDPTDWSCDIICGGDPCQENSAARVTSGTTAPSLGAEFLRVVSLLRPRFVVRENPSRVRKDAPWPWWRFRDALRELDYVVQPLRFRACCFGYSHRRERLLLLAQRADSHREPLWVPGRGETSGEAGPVQGEAQQRQRVRPDPGPVVRGERSGGDPGVGRVPDGVSSGVDRSRLKALGNALVPDIAEFVGRLLVAAK